MSATPLPGKLSRRQPAGDTARPHAFAMTQPARRTFLVVRTGSWPGGRRPPRVRRLPAKPRSSPPGLPRAGGGLRCGKRRRGPAGCMTYREAERGEMLRSFAGRGAATGVGGGDGGERGGRPGAGWMRLAAMVARSGEQGWRSCAPGSPSGVVLAGDLGQGRARGSPGGGDRAGGGRLRGRRRGRSSLNRTPGPASAACCQVTVGKASHAVSATVGGGPGSASRWADLGG